MQIIYSGIKHLSEALKNSKKVLLVCDSSFPFLNIKEDIEGIALPYTIFDDFTPENLEKRFGGKAEDLIYGENDCLFPPRVPCENVFFPWEDKNKILISEEE